MSYLNYIDRFKNLMNNENVDFSSKHKKNYDVHHIFPSQFLDDNNIENNTDSILNKMIMCKTLNEVLFPMTPRSHIFNHSKKRILKLKIALIAITYLIILLQIHRLIIQSF